MERNGIMAKMTRIKAALTGTGSREVAFVWDADPLASEVYLAGSFNLWDPKAHRMLKKNGAFRTKVHLAPGEHQYKFVVDGEWHNDPAAATQARNEFGGTNSVVQV